MGSRLDTLPVRKYEGYALFIKSATTDASVDTDVRTIQGFASMRGMDRDFDDIDPGLFDIEKFMENPRVLVNHTLWKREDGNEVDAGNVTLMRVAYAVKGSNIGDVDIVDLEDKKTITTVSEQDHVASPGDYGLWVEAEIMEKGVIELIDAGRLGAFSWSGSLIYRMNKDVIDMREVSVVTIPAHPDALFIIKKDFSLNNSSLAVSEDGTIRVIEDEDQLTELSGPAVDVAKAFPYAVLSKRITGGQSMLPLRKYKNDEEATKHVQELLEGNSELSHILLLKHANKLFDDDLVYTVVHTSVHTDRDSTLWTKSYIDNLPDSAFAFISSGGVLDGTGRTEPRGFGLFPIANHKGVLNADRIKEALKTVQVHPVSSPVRHAIVSAAVEAGVLSKSEEAPSDEVDDALLGAGDGESDTKTEGGDGEMTDEQVKAIMAGFEGLTSRFDALEKMVTAKEESEEEKPSAESTDEGTTEKSAPPQKEEETKSADDQKFEALMGMFKGVSDNMSELTTRIEKMEIAPQESKGATEADGAVADKEAQLLEKSKNMAGEDRKVAVRGVITRLLTEPPRK